MHRKNNLSLSFTRESRVVGLRLRDTGLVQSKRRLKGASWDIQYLEISPCPGTTAEKEDEDPASQPWQVHIQSTEQGAADAKSESAWKLQHFSDGFSC